MLVVGPKSAQLHNQHVTLTTGPDYPAYVRSTPELVPIQRLQRILVAHADPITDRPAQQLVEAWDFAIPSDLTMPAS